MIKDVNLVLVAILGSRGYVQHNNFLDVLPHPQGLGPISMALEYLFGTLHQARTTILTRHRGD